MDCDRKIHTRFVESNMAKNQERICACSSFRVVLDKFLEKESKAKTRAKERKLKPVM